MKYFGIDEEKKAIRKALKLSYLYIIFSISKNKVSAVQQWYREQGLTPRRKKSGGRVECKRVLSYEDAKRVFQFIDNFAEVNALLLPGRVAGFKRADLRLLPSTNSKASIWRDYYKPAMEKLGRPNKINIGIKAALKVFLA